MVPGGDNDAGTGSGSGGGGSGGSGQGSQGPTVIAAAPGANQLALDDVNVYWSSEKASGSWRTWHHTINATAKTGGSVATVFDGPGAFVNGLIARGGSVYWSVETCLDPCDRNELEMFNVYSAPRTGGAFTIYNSDSRGQLALDDSRIYLVTHARFESRLWSMSIARNSDPVNLQVSNVVAGPVMDGLTLYAGTVTRDSNGTASVSFVKLRKTGDADPSVISLWHSSDGGGRLVLHSGNLFVRGGGVWRIPLDGSDPQLLWATSSDGDIDANGGHVYWTQNPIDGYPGCLGRANLDGTDGQCIDEGDHQYGGVRVDDTSVFFIRDGQILRLPR